MARLGFTYSAHQHDAIVVRHCQLGPRMEIHLLLLLTIAYYAVYFGCVIVQGLEWSPSQAFSG